METARPDGGDSVVDAAVVARPAVAAYADLSIRQPMVQVADNTADLTSANVSIESTTSGANIVREHEVKRGNSLWQIARQELQSAGIPASNIPSYIKQIIEANNQLHPGLASRPDKLSLGMKLAIPQFKSDTGSNQPASQPDETRVRRPKPVNPQTEADRPVPSPPEGDVHRPPAVEPGKHRPVAQRDRPSADPRFRATESPETSEIVASWYGRRFHGRLTANGETYNMNAYTVAHKTLPFGTVVRFTNHAGLSVEARVTDRGPYIEGRDFDLSRQVAKHMGLLGHGVGSLKATILGQGPRSRGGYWRT